MMHFLPQPVPCFIRIAPTGRSCQRPGETVDKGTQERFLLWVPAGACDQKKEDAIAALEYIRNLAGLSSDP